MSRSTGAADFHCLSHRQHDRQTQGMDVEFMQDPMPYAASSGFMPACCGDPKSSVVAFESSAFQERARRTASVAISTRRRESRPTVATSAPFANQYLASSGVEQYTPASFFAR